MYFLQKIEVLLHIVFQTFFLLINFMFILIFKGAAPVATVLQKSITQMDDLKISRDLKGKRMFSILSVFHH